jgi:deoxycytidylate deaminase
MRRKYPELVFALVGPMGTDLELVERSLTDSLTTVGYKAVDVRLSDLMRDIHPDLPPKNAPGYHEEAIKKGNGLRERLRRPDAFAALAMASIRRRREKNETAATKDERRAYILRSLKRPEEVELLKDVYGASLFVISAYAPRAERVDRMATQLAEKEFRNRRADHRSEAERLIRTDESESNEYGQDVRSTYALADFFVNTSQMHECSAAVQRFVALIFGHPWHTPTRDEQFMAMAYVASLRSGSPARQVGAALTGKSGNLLSVGTNEVPSPGGGQYWEGDSNDHRDSVFDSLDTSDRMRRNLLSDVLYRLKHDLKVLNENVSDVDTLLKPGSQSYKFLRKAQLFDTIDFIRAVHAEAAALFSACASPVGGTLYVTTFPCHECARHIVICGVARVVYIEPYPKSLVSELFNDSIEVDSKQPCSSKVQFNPFTGISPTIYQHLFSLTRKSRKANDGTLIRWLPGDSKPRLHLSYSEPASTEAEYEVLQVFESQLMKEGLLDDSVPRAT